MSTEATTYPAYIHTNNLNQAAQELSLPGYWELGEDSPDDGHHVGHLSGLTKAGITHVAVLDSTGDVVVVYVNRGLVDTNAAEKAARLLGADGLYN